MPYIIYLEFIIVKKNIKNFIRDNIKNKKFGIKCNIYIDANIIVIFIHRLFYITLYNKNTCAKSWKLINFKNN